MDRLLDNLLRHQSDVVWCMEVEPTPRFRYVNDAASAVLGHPPQALLDDVELWFRMVHRADLGLLGVGPQAADPLSGASGEGGVTVRFFRSDGQQRWAEVRMRRVSEGDETFIFGVTRDVTDRMDAVAEERRIARRLTQAEALADVGTYDWDVVADRMWFSTNLYRIFGQDPETWTPSYANFEAMMLPTHRENATAALIHAATTGDDFRDDVEILRPDGSVRTIEILALIERADAGELARVHGVIKDITAQKAESTARRLFLADIAHELRTPVAGVVGAGHTLRAQVGREVAEPSPELGALLDLLDRQGERLRRLSQMLSELSDLEHQLAAAEIGVIELVEVVDAAREAVEVPDGIEVVIDVGDRQVLAEEWRLQRIVEQLLANAVRYADARVEVSVAVRDDGLSLRIVDDGPGVDAAEVPHLFTEFHRGVTETGVGSGLGLALVRRLAETIRAEVHYREAAGRGACFVVQLRVPTS